MPITPTITSFTSGGKSIPAELFAPGAANGGTIIVVYGSDGLNDTERGPWKTMIEGYAEELAQRGFIALIPEYFARTGPVSPIDPALVPEMIQLHRSEWQETLADAVTFAKTLRDVDGSRIGLLGFSLGGHLVLRLRAIPKVLVEFFAPELPLIGGLGSSVRLTLDAQIHHGKADDVVPFDPNAKNIDDQLRVSGASSTLFHDYDGAGHGFTGSDRPNAEARTKAKDRTITFFGEKL
jgi:carboxymethylenebutenolidase